MTCFTQSTLIPAMVTPFQEEGSLDIVAIKSLAAYLINKQDCDGLLVNGTTGECPTTTMDERCQILTHAKDATQGTVPVLSGCGSNNTAQSIEQALAFAEARSDGLLLSTPYYNKPSQAGLVAHFKAVATSVRQLPIMLYNIPSRTGVTIAPETMLTVHQACPNVVGVKQSLGCMETVTQIKTLLPASFHLWSGDDPLTLPMMSCGAQGVVSVLAHVLGRPIKAMITAMASGDVQTAQALHQQLMPLGQQLFTLPNPTIIKAILAQQELIGPTMRLPMIPPNDDDMHLVTDLVDQINAITPTHSL